MRLFLASLVFFGSGTRAHSAYQQQLIPILREIKTSSAPSVTEWKTFVRTSDYGGAVYVPLVQVAELLNGHLRWAPVSKTVDLSVHNETIRFPYNSKRVWISGRLHRLAHPTVKNEDGFWVPVSFFASPDFFRTTRAKLAWPPAPVPHSPAHPLARSPAPAPNLQRSIRRIVIDPGHGGEDWGATASGRQAKDITLAVARKLRDRLQARGVA